MKPDPTADLDRRSFATIFRHTICTLSVLASLFALLFGGALAISHCNQPAILDDLPPLNQIAGAYTLNPTTRYKIVEQGHFNPEGVGRLVLLPDGTVKCDGGKLLFRSRGHVDSDIVFIPDKMATGHWRTEVDSSKSAIDQNYITVIFRDEAQHEHTHTFLLMRNCSGLLLCEPRRHLDDDYSIFFLTRTSL